MFRKINLLLLMLVFISTMVNATIKLPAIIGDNMVLQQKSKACFWGSAAINKRVTISVSWTNQKYYCVSNASGEWKTFIPTPAASGPFTIKISDGAETELHNILIGEVWLCSGQSNMEMPLKGFMGLPVTGSLDAILDANSETDIHFITIKRKASKTPVSECAGDWKTADAANVPNVSAVAYFFAKYLRKVLHVPVGLICSSWGGANIQAWTDKETLSAFPEVSFQNLNKDISQISKLNQEPALLYNGMISPLLNYTFKGTIWYQGEANRSEAPLYKKIFPAMVKSWRGKFNNPDMPFYYVQIAPFCGRDCDATENAELRQVQLDCLKIIPNSGMAVTSDIGEGPNVHPPDKNDVGKRLALWALAKTYNINIPFSGPLISKARKDSAGNIVLHFDHVKNGFFSTEQELNGFEIADKDGQFHAAKAVIKGNDIVLINKDIQEPVIVRFCYKNFIIMKLFNTEGLPASSFRIPVTE